MQAIEVKSWLKRRKLYGVFAAPLEFAEQLVDVSAIEVIELNGNFLAMPERVMNVRQGR